MRKSACRHCIEGVVFDRETCSKIIARHFCDIEYYDEDVGCNKNCHGYSRKCVAKKKGETKMWWGFGKSINLDELLNGINYWLW